MTQRIPRSIWLTTFLLAVPVGSLLGFAIMLQNWAFLSAYIGWFIIPLVLFSFLAHTLSSGSSDPGSWLQWLGFLGYLLALLGYSVCAYWTIRLTRSTSKGLFVTVMAVLISTVASVPVAMVTMSINQDYNFFSVLHGYFYQSGYNPPALLIHVYILINLLFSAIFGWLIAMGLIKFGKAVVRQPEGAILH